MKQKNKSVSWKINGGTNSGEQNKVKRMKRTQDSSLGPYQMNQHSTYRGPRRRREKERV